MCTMLAINATEENAETTRALTKNRREIESKSPVCVYHVSNQCYGRERRDYTSSN